MSKYRVWFFVEETHHAYVDFEAENAKDAEMIFNKKHPHGAYKVEEIPKIVKTWYTFDCTCTDKHKPYSIIAHNATEARKWLKIMFPSWKCKLVHVGA